MVWKGKWESKMYPKGFCFGQAEFIWKPSDSGTITFLYQGIYRNGQRDEIECSVKMDSTMQIKEIMCTKGSMSGKSLQTFTFEVKSSRENYIEGTYKTSNPNDRGTLTLVRM